MYGTSICPHCHATFTIGEMQFTAKNGLIRCGRCLNVLDFRLSYIANEPNPQLELPIAETANLDFTPNASLAPPSESDIQKIIGYSDFTAPNDPIHPESKPLNDIGVSSDNANESSDIETVLPIDDSSIETLLPVEIAPSEHDHKLVIKSATFSEPPEVEYEFSKKPIRYWPWLIATGFLFVTSLLQASYYFKVELAANFPTSKPILTSICNALKCSIPLPQHANLINIESSDLEDAPQNHVVLNALLRNHASYTQAFPSLELTLTDFQDNPLARRYFSPEDYLSGVTDRKIGFLANQEINIKLHLDTQDIKPSGYRLVLFYANN